MAVCEKLAALLMLVDRFGEARAVALDGLARTPAEDTLRAARLQHLLGNIEYQDLRLGCGKRRSRSGREIDRAVRAGRRPGAGRHLAGRTG